MPRTHDACGRFRCACNVRVGSPTQCWQRDIHLYDQSFDAGYTLRGELGMPPLGVTIDMPAKVTMPCLTSTPMWAALMEGSQPSSAMTSNCS